MHVGNLGIYIYFLPDMLVHHVLDELIIPIILRMMDYTRKWKNLRY